MPSWPPTAHAVMRRDSGGAADPFGRPAPRWAKVWEGEVVPAPDAGSDLTDSNRPSGTVASLTLHLPESCTEDPRGCRFALGAPYSGTYEVTGDPEPYAKGLLGWRTPVRVKRVEG